MTNIKEIIREVRLKLNDGKELVLVETKTKVEIITDGTEHPRVEKGLITFVNEDGIIIENEDMIFWEYVEDIKIID